MTIVTYSAARPRWPDANDFHPFTSFADYDAAMSKQGIKVAEFKMTQGTWVDPQGTRALKLFEDHGYVLIAYDYLANIPDASAFLKAFPPQAGHLPCIDFENVGKAVSVSATEAWINAVHKAYGRYPAFYGHGTWIAAGQPAGTVVSQCPYIGPSYGSTLSVPRGVGPLLAHQYSDGKIGPEPHTFPGVSGPCDMNSMLCTYAQLQAWAGMPKPVTFTDAVALNHAGTQTHFFGPLRLRRATRRAKRVLRAERADVLKTGNSAEVRIVLNRREKK